MFDGLGEGGVALIGLGKVGGDPECAGEIVGVGVAGDEYELGPLGMEEAGEGSADAGGSAGEKSFRARDAHKDQ